VGQENYVGSTAELNLAYIDISAFIQPTYLYLLTKITDRALADQSSLLAVQKANLLSTTEQNSLDNDHE